MGGEWLALVTSILAAISVALGARIALGDQSRGLTPQRFVQAMALGTGVLVIAVLLDFLPDAWEGADAAAPWGILVGVLLIWGVTQVSDRWFQKSLLSTPVESSEPLGPTEAPLVQFTVASAYVLMISLSFHTFLEGMSLAIAMQSVDASSIEFIIALLIHKLPEGLLWGLAILTAFPTVLGVHRQRLWYALLVPAACVLLGTLAGVGLIHMAASSVLAFMSAIMAGALLYICLSELLPTLREHGTTPFIHLSFAIGLILMLIPIGIGRIVGA